MGASDYISRPFDAQVVHQRVFNTIKLYAKQRHLISLVTDQIQEKEKHNRMMVSILSQIVEFRNGESGSHVLHINTITGHAAGTSDAENRPVSSAVVRPFHDTTAFCTS